MDRTTVAKSIGRIAAIVGKIVIVAGVLI